MTWDYKYIENILADLTDENPLACQALLKISKVVFTTRIPTLAVTLGNPPRLLINHEFLDEHAKTENDVKALLMHEFMHVILGHTESYKKMTPLLNIALDAVINAIIHRAFGPKYSDFFKALYKEEGIECLLRPMGAFPVATIDYMPIHDNVYSGKYAADDLYELMEYLLEQNYLQGKLDVMLLGNHTRHEKPSMQTQKILDEILKKMDGTNIWNKSHAPGIGENENSIKGQMSQSLQANWRRSSYAILKACLSSDKAKCKKEAIVDIRMPILSNTDRRSVIRSLWSPIIPMSVHHVSDTQVAESANIYLDVSGSMSREINALIHLLHHFRKYIRKPLWVFSNTVSEAVFTKGVLEYNSSGGTNISQVFEHIRNNNIKKSLIITDGYVGNITEEMLSEIDIGNLRILISSDGNATDFEEHNIINYQLEELQS